MEPGELADRQAIADLAARYCRAIDRRELDSLREIYAPGGIDHHTGFSGPVEEFIPWLSRLLPTFDGTLHVIGNHLAEVRGDSAIAETYATAHHWGSPSEDPAKNFTTTVRYVDDLVRLEGRWRIRERWAVRERALSDVGRSLPRTHAGAPPAGPVAAHDSTDPFARLAARFRRGEHPK